MKFTTSNQSFVFEPISTPNKNIQSYFMKNEQTFFTPEELKYPNYCVSEALTCFFIGNDYFYIDNIKIEQDCIVNDRFNVEKYGSRQKCIDQLYSLLYLEIKNKNSQNNEQKIEKNMCLTQNSSKEDISIEDSVKFTGIKKDSKIQLIISDFMGRSDIIAIIDVLLNSLGFKCIMLIPFSLCLSFNLNHSHSAYIYKNGFSFVDDFCLIDSFDFYSRNEKYEKILVDDIDFAEEYSRLTILDETMMFSCDECGIKEDSEEKIIAHTLKEHNSSSFIKFEKTDSFETTFMNRMRYLFKREQFDKISTKIYSIGIDFTGAERLENAIEQAISGAKLFSNLEISKELWMTDCEWRIARLRILKEKLLFYI